MANLSDLAPTPGMLGSGLAQMAGSAIVDRRAYNKYVIEAQSTGETPVSFEVWKESQSNG